MSIDVYKKVAIEILAGLDNKDNAVIAVSSSNEQVDINELAKNLTDAFCSMNLSVNLVNAKVDGGENIALTEPKKVNDKLFEYVYDKNNSAKITSLSAKEDIEKIKLTANITAIAVDIIPNSAPAMMLSSCTDGIVLAEKKNVSRTDEIDKAIAVINNISVKPLGFVLI